MPRILFAFLVLVLSICTNALANSVGKKQTFIEADFVKMGENNSFFANGHAIVRRQNLLMNAGEVKAIKQVKKAKRQQEKNSRILQVKDEKSGEEKYIFYANDWVKIRTDDDNIIYAKSMFRDENTDISLMKNVQIFPGGNRDHTEIYSTELQKENCISTLKDVSMCPCKLFLDDNVESNRKTPFYSMTDEEELLDKPLQQNSIDNTDEEMHDKLKKTFISVRSDRIIHDKENATITFEKMKWRILGIPVFYIPKYTLHTDNSGDSGFLFPRLVISKSKQTGIELPFYWKIRNDMDLIVSRSQYFDIGLLSWMTNVGSDVRNNLHNPDKRMQLRDLSNYRTSHTDFKFRHLVSTSNAYESFYTLEGLIMDWSQLVDEDTGMGATKGNKANGEKIKGIRWMADFKARLKLSKTTFLNISQYYASDGKIAYMYLGDARQIRTNSIHLYDVAYNRYISAEVYTYQSALLRIDDKTTPIVFPVLRADYDFKKDKLGGNFYIKSKAYYINRKEGFSTATAGVDGGYHLPYYFKNGTKITADTLLRLQYNHVSYNDFSEMSYFPHQYAWDNLKYYFGNLPGFVQRSYYANSNILIYGLNAFNKFSILNFNKVQAEHSILVKSLIGRTTITPRVAIRYSPNDRRNLYLPVEDNFGMNMNYYNAFELLQSSGYGVYDTGGSVVYGTDVSHRFKKGFELQGGIAQNIRLGNAIDERYLADFTGYRRTASDLMGNFGFKFSGVSGNGVFNYDLQRGEMRMFLFNISYGMKYFFVSLGYSSFSKYSNIFGINMDSLNGTITLTPIKDLKVSASANFNLNGMDAPNRKIAPGFTSYRLMVQYKISCVTLGFSVSENKIRLNNMPSTVLYRFMIKFSGFG